MWPRPVRWLDNRTILALQTDARSVLFPWFRRKCQNARLRDRAATQRAADNGAFSPSSTHAGRSVAEPHSLGAERSVLRRLASHLMRTFSWQLFIPKAVYVHVEHGITVQRIVEGIRLGVEDVHFGYGPQRVQIERWVLLYLLRHRRPPIPVSEVFAKIHAIDGVPYLGITTNFNVEHVWAQVISENTDSMTTVPREPELR